MDSSESGPKTATDYINTLNECDGKIVGLLRVLGDALRCLTAEGGNSRLTAEQRRAIFQLKMADFAQLLADVRDTQQRAIHALRDTATGESGRIGPAAATAAAAANTSADADGRGDAEPLRAILGELGDLDLSVLNTNNDDVIRQIEAEQWAKAADLVRGLLAQDGKQEGDGS